MNDIRCGNDDLGIDQFTVEGGVCTVLVRGSDERVALALQPLPQAKLVLSGSEKFRHIPGVLVTLHKLLSLNV